MQKVAHPRLTSLLFGVALAAGCTGSVDSLPPSEDGTPTNPGPGKGPGTKPDGTPIAGPGGPGPGTTLPPAANCTQSSALPEARLWRLSPRQYVNTVKALFGVDVDIAALPADGVSDDKVSRFDTNSEKNLVGDRLAAVYRDQAGAIARAVLGKLPSAQACVTTTADDACVQTFVRDHASRAYRRPLASGEVDRLASFFKASATKHGAAIAARMTLEAILQSPHFLYRFELGDAQTGARVPLTQHEMASQLSYFLADAPPDAALLESAARNELSNPQVVKMHAQRLVSLPGGRAKAQSFFLNFFGLNDLLDGKPKDPKFTTFTDALRRELVNETLTFVDKVLFENKGSLETLFTADYSYQNASLAKHYGTSATGTDLSRVTLNNGRSGVLSHAGVIASISNESTTSPVHRGLFFYQNMLCRTLPLPPPDASNQFEKLTDPANPNGTQREQWAYFARTQTACVGCHTLFHPLGLSLENFDAIGRHRTTENGKTIDPSVALSGYGPDLDGMYKDGLALGKAVASSQEGRECFALQYTTFAFGRSVDTEAEKCRMATFGQRLKDGNMSLQELLVAMTQDESFYFRRY